MQKHYLQLNTGLEELSQKKEKVALKEKKNLINH